MHPRMSARLESERKRVLVTISFYSLTSGAIGSIA
jgi:hypothetical protein